MRGSCWNRPAATVPPAIAAAALLVMQDDPSAVLWVMSADSSMQRAQNLPAAIDAAVAAARAGHIAMFGMRPTAPDTGYGYIGVGDALDDAPGAYGLSRFVEAPDADAAALMVASGKHFWHAGMFVFRADTMLAEMEKHAPAMLSAVRRAVEAAREDLSFIRLDPQAFAASPDLSLEGAVIAQTDRAAVVPADLGWSDVSGWGALWEMGEKDARGNVMVGDVLLEGADNCYVRSDGIVTAVVGLENAVVVVTEDAVLVMHRDPCAGGQEGRRPVAQGGPAGGGGA